jgi:hypothetical protein
MPFTQEQCELLVNRIGEDEATRLLSRMLFSRIPGDAEAATNEGLNILMGGNENNNVIEDDNDEDDATETYSDDEDDEEDDDNWIDANGQSEIPIVINRVMYSIWNSQDIYLNGIRVGHIDEDRHYIINGINILG